MNRIRILPHYGLGDAIICKGFIRNLKMPAAIACHPKHEPSIAWLFKDIDAEVVPIASETEALAWAKSGKELVLVGHHGPPFDSDHFVEEFARQFDEEVDVSWSKFSVAYDESIQVPRPSRPYAFVHQDPSRGMWIINQVPVIPWAEPIGSDNIFAYLELIHGASEIHVIDSCFLNLIDRYPLVSGKLFFHRYAKPQPNPPLLKRNWTVIE